MGRWNHRGREGPAYAPLPCEERLERLESFTIKDMDTVLEKFVYRAGGEDLKKSALLPIPEGMRLLDKTRRNVKALPKIPAALEVHIYTLKHL